MKKSKYKPVYGYKGFDSLFCCINKQYEVGKTARCFGAPKLCSNGLHFCTRPIDVLTYYGPTHGSRYAKVVAKGMTLNASSNPDSLDQCLSSKHVTTVLDVTKEISLKDLIFEQNEMDFKEKSNCEVILSEDMDKPRLVVKGTALDDVIEPTVSISTRPYSSSFCEATFGMTVVSVAMGLGSMATGMWSRSIAVACGPYSAVWTRQTCSVAVARSYDTVILCSEAFSTGVALEPRVVMFMEGRNSVATVPCSANCIVHLNAAEQTAVVNPGNNVIVKGKNCVVVLTAEPFGYEQYVLIAGTTVIVPIGIQVSTEKTPRKRIRHILIEVDRTLRMSGESLLSRALTLAGEHK